ncbi:MAG: MMPL family transporter [Proteobacteria bacterium]|nr:MMPL family transporter [Pseudomonadota bacterium]
MLQSAIETVVRWCSRHAGAVALSFLVAAVAAILFDISAFKMNSNTSDIVSRTAPWRQREKAFDAAFPQFSDLIVVVIDGATPERAEQAAQTLSTALQGRKDHFLSVRRPGGTFFAQNGILFLSTKEVEDRTSELIRAQPFLGALAGDPSLRGIMTSLSTAALASQHGAQNLVDLKGPLRTVAVTLNGVLSGKPSFLSWRALVTKTKADKRELRQFIEVKPRRDFGSLLSAAAAMREIRDVARSHGLVPEHGVRVRLTGDVPMQDEEFSTLAERAVLLSTLMMAGILLMLRLAVRSPKLILAILVTLIAGLALTAAFGLLALGAFNVISVAFIPLFVGLGVDFGIQFAVRYRAERHARDDLKEALAAAGAGIGGVLTLAAAAIAAGFFSLLPAGYAGVAELGLIAGVGMIVTFVLSLTLLPALIVLLGPGGEPEKIGFSGLATVDRAIASHWRFIVGTAAALTVLGLAAIPALQFDFNPLDLRSPKVESVATALDLMKDTETSPNTVDVLAADLQAADRLAARLKTLPEVSQVLTVDSFIPDGQPEKLAAIADASMLLDPTINPFVVKPPPSDTEMVASLKSTARDLRSVVSTPAASSFARDASQLAAILDRLSSGPASLRARASDALVPSLQTMLQQVRTLLQAQPVTRTSLPQEMVEDWVSAKGLYRVQVTPRGNSNDNAVLRRFTRAVATIAPEITGSAVIIQETGKTIVRAFIVAGILSFVAIFVLLLFWLRNTTDVLLALVPLLLAGLLTLAISVMFGLQLNFANIIALPLLFGIGVAFDIYFVMARRSGARNLLQSPLTRAVILSAGTTACGFGMLSLSSHPGTASMGLLLIVSLGWILAVVLLLLPALFEMLARRQS